MTNPPIGASPAKPSDRAKDANNIKTMTSNIPKGWDREAVARVIDPKSWEYVDQLRRDHTPPKADWAMVQPSLAKADTILSMLSAAPVVPEGRKLVPFPATEEMLKASWVASHALHGDEAPSWESMPEDYRQLVRDAHGASFDAMLSVGGGIDSSSDARPLNSTSSELQAWEIEAYDDGSIVKLRFYSGGGSPEGPWGTLGLIFTAPDGTETIRDYEATGPRREWDVQSAPPPPTDGGQS